jgi:replication initiation and membrane attachment protein
MNILENNSTCSITKEFDLSNLDQEVLTYLYLPILGSDCYSLYLGFYHFSSLMGKIGGFLHSDFLEYIKMKDSDFLMARTRLEAIGLLEVYRKEERDQTSQLKVNYLYQLLPPASPRKFFNDVFLRALLNEALGNKKYYFLSGYFKVFEKKLDDGFLNVTTPFKDVFSMSVKEGDASLEPMGLMLEDKNYKSLANFDKKNFRKKLKESNYSFESIKSDWDDIVDICSLYDPSIDDACQIILQNTDSDGNFYFEHFKKDIRDLRQFQVRSVSNCSDDTGYGDGRMAKLLKTFNSISPDQYLSVVFNSKPATFMLEEIEKLKQNLGFSNPIINVILDYCLKKTKNEFNCNYIEKVAYTLSSLNVSNAYDAMTKLSSRDFESAQASRKKKSFYNSKKVEKKSEETSSSGEIVSQEDLDAFDKEFGL